MPSPRHQLIVVLAAGLLAASLALEALRIAAPATLAGSDQPELLNAALVLDPSNAEIYHRLGMLRHYSQAEADPATGMKWLRRATQLDPNEALYWSDLASACESSGNTACADDAFEHALSCSPLTPRICWAAANYDLRSGRPERALQLFRRLLDLDPGYAAPTFEVCLSAIGNPRLIAQELVARDRSADLKMAFVSFMSAHGDDDTAYATWRRLVSEESAAGLRLTATSVAPYLNHLIDSGREGEALSVWADLRQLIAVPGDHAAWRASQDTNLIFNGGFESDLLNWGFDWRYRSFPYVALGVSRLASHCGSRSLHLEFTVAVNEECEPVYQMVPVNPNQSYVLTAFVRSQSISSDSGPRLRVVDPFCSGCLNLTADTLGTTTWHQVQRIFSTAPQTHLVRISVWRPRSRSFPAEITGEFWLDDVSLTAAGFQENAAIASHPATPASVHVASLR